MKTGDRIYTDLEFNKVLTLWIKVYPEADLKLIIKNKTR